MIEKIRGYLPGIMLSATIALASAYLSEHYGGPAMLFALLLGIAFNFLADSSKTGPGIQFSSKRILRVGVALLGARITWTEVQNLGAETVALVVSGVLVTLVVGTGIARLLKLPRSFGVLTAGAVAICGASAALAISSVLPNDSRSERWTIVTVVGVTALSTIAMMVYPLFSAFLQFDDTAAGVFIGATIHDVAQVIGAGYTISTEAGDTAAIVKLLRVSCLLPVVVAIGFLQRGSKSADAPKVPLLPLFLFGFVVLVAANSFGLISPDIAAFLGTVSRWCLLCAVAALGIRTSLGELAVVGPRPLLAMVSQTALLALFAIGGLLYLD
nr:putative sulfate exporter family transporter [Woeseia oceani]